MIVRPSPFRRAVLLLLVIVLTTTGCARIKGIFKDEDENEGVPVEQLYDKGHGMMEGGNWSGATTAFKRLVAQYPYGAYTEQALMEIAFAHPASASTVTFIGLAMSTTMLSTASHFLVKRT